MKWFKKWFRNQCIQAWETKDDDSEIITENYPIKLRNRSRSPATLVSNDIRTPNGPGITFVLYPATGGNILEIRVYDDKIGEHAVSLHIIPLNQELGESIGKIITLEALKR